MTTSTVNPEREQDRAEDLLSNFRSFGHVMFHQQRAIYWKLSTWLEGRTVLEAGCGVGTGTAILHRLARSIVGTDKLQVNVSFAKCLYPWINFGTWDIKEAYHGPPMEVVVAVEVIEHVADAAVAIKHLLAAATREVWTSTPNGKGKERPPANPYHVQEYTVAEMRAMLAPHAAGIEVFGWERFEAVPDDTDVSPLVYRVKVA